MTFHIGQEVVCVDDSFDPSDIRFDTSKGLGGLRRGRVYTVAGHGICGYTGEPLVLIKGIFRSPLEGGFYAHRFRPAVKRKTDISIFTAMLTPSKTKVKA